MKVEDRSDQPFEMSLFPIPQDVIRFTFDQVKANPKATIVEDLKEIRLSQPILNWLIEKHPYNDLGLNLDFYKYGISRAYRFFRNHAFQSGFDLPEISQIDLKVLQESIKEDQRLKILDPFTKSIFDKTVDELQDGQYDLWMALQEMSTNPKQYPSYMRGVLTVFFLFKTHQEVEILNKQFETS